jgi:hypothetical protein
MAHHCRVQRPNQVCQPLYRSARSAASAAVDCSAVSGIDVATAAVPGPARSVLARSVLARNWAQTTRPR